VVRDAFFEWAMSVQEQRDQYEAELADPLTAERAKARVPWPEAWLFSPLHSSVR
jgi:hypothetical protein